MNDVTTMERDWSTVEQVLVSGDLAKLTPQQRVLYYNRTCESLGLNPLTKPFAYINLNGKLVMYALRDCADQLRAIRDVSVKLGDSKIVNDVFIVRAHARLPNGREDEATGAVFLGKLQGEALANAMMKAETKAKRRVTLSICGLGFSDESEIADIPRATIRANVNPETSEVADLPPAAETAPAIDYAIKADDMIALLRSAKSADQFREFWDRTMAEERAVLAAEAPEEYRRVVQEMRTTAADWRASSEAAA